MTLNLLAPGNRGGVGESASSVSTRKLEQGEDIQIGSSTMELVSDHRYFEKVFKNMGKKLNLAEEAPVTGVEALKTNVLIWGLFMSTMMKAAIHRGPNYTESLEVYRNTNFEEFIRCSAEIHLGPSNRNPECVTKSLDRSLMDEMRFQYCMNSKNSLPYIRAIQGHTGGNLIMSLFHTNGKIFRFIEDIRLIVAQSSNQDSSLEDETIFFTPLNPFGDNLDEEEPGDGLSKPRKVHCYSEWKLVRTPSTGSI